MPSVVHKARGSLPGAGDDTLADLVGYPGEMVGLVLLHWCRDQDKVRDWFASGT